MFDKYVNSVLFENVQEAICAKKYAELQLDTIKTCKTIAFFSPVITIVLVFFASIILTPLVSLSEFFTCLFLIPVLFIPCFCYAKVKCFGYAIRWAIGGVKWGWLLCPLFPIDLLTAYFGLCLGGMAIVFFPAIVLRDVGKHTKEALCYANEYLYTHAKN